MPPGFRRRFAESCSPTCADRPGAPDDRFFALRRWVGIAGENRVESPANQSRHDAAQPASRDRWTPTTLAAAQEIDFSLLALFWRASFTVKLVMLMLIAGRFWSWSIIIQKFIAYRRARREAAVFDRAFWSGEPLDELLRRRSGRQPAGASAKDLRRRHDRMAPQPPPGWRADRRRAGAHRPGDGCGDRQGDRAAERAGCRFWPPSGSTAPFVGLFGTVWGIKVAFEEIAISAEHLACGGGARHRRGAGGDRARPAGGDPGGDLLQQAFGRQRPDHRAATKPSPTSSPRSCRASWTRLSDGRGGDEAGRRRAAAARRRAARRRR